MKFNINFSMDNAAFDDFPQEEVEKILKKVIDQYKRGSTESKIRDTNGNVVGQWEITEN